MHLIPKEVDKLVITQAGRLSQERLARGLKLNHAEATALITHVLQEVIRDGNSSVSEVMSLGKHILGRRHVLPSVVSTLSLLQVEGTFATGTHLVTVEQPISSEDGDVEMALYGNALQRPSKDVFPISPESDYAYKKSPGAILPADACHISFHPTRKRQRVTVTNCANRPIQVGSHFHFMETNPQLKFDRTKAYGYHLDLFAGAMLRFEPGSTRTVTLVQFGGHKIIRGGSGLATGMVDQSRVDTIIHRLQEAGYLHTPETSTNTQELQAFTMDRQSYAANYGPTVGDSVRLGSTELWIKVEKDYTTYGDECCVGDGKVLRDGIGQASGKLDSECLDLLVANVTIVDWTGIFKADIGVRDGVIVGIGKAGNPDILDGVDPAMVVGSNTDIISAEGMIVTAGGVDTHAHLICPQQADEALASGITTMFGGGTGPSAASKAVNCCASKTYIRQIMQSCDWLPVNYGIIGRGSDSGKAGLSDMCNAGVAALKVHEDFGCTPSTIDSCLSVCEEHDIQCQIHTDSLNESGFVEETVAAFKNRAIHVYHVEGAGGGHTPDVIRLVQEPNILPSSTTPTMPYTTNTADEHVDMVITCHRLSKSEPDELAFAKSRIRHKTIAAEDVLHDTGAISIMSSDSQAMGRCGEVVIRTWNTAHKNKTQRGPLPEDNGTGADNHRAKRYISKYTINPAIAQGVGHIIGSIEVGKLADLVIWEPSNFGSKPYQVLKKGFIASAQMGDSNAAVPTVQPIVSRRMFSPMVPRASVMFVSKSAVKNGSVRSYGLKKQIECVKNCRNVNKYDMKYNCAAPRMDVDETSYTVRADGVECKAEPSSSVPLAKQYLLY